MLKPEVLYKLENSEVGRDLAKLIRERVTQAVISVLQLADDADDAYVLSLVAMNEMMTCVIMGKMVSKGLKPGDGIKDAPSVAIEVTQDAQSLVKSRLLR